MPIKEPPPTKFFTSLLPHIEGTEHLPFLRKIYWQFVTEEAAMRVFRPDIHSKKMTLAEAMNHPMFDRSSYHRARLERARSYNTLMFILSDRIAAINLHRQREEREKIRPIPMHEAEMEKLLAAKAFLEGLKSEGRIK